MHAGEQTASGGPGFDSLLPLGDFLEYTFSDVPKNFNVVHINAQSIPASYSDMLASLDQKHIHAIVVSETWLKPNLPTVCYSLPGFILIRNDRTSVVGGGVCIYLKANIPFSVISQSSQPPPANAGEHLFIEVTLSTTKILLGAYYSPNRNVNYFSSFDNLLSTYCPSYSHSIIMGDFNTCLLKQDLRSSKLESIVSSNNLHLLPLTATHHFPNCTPSLLDLMMVTSLQHIAKHGQYTASNFSCHDLIFLSYKIRPPKLKPSVILQRNFSGMDREALLKDAENIDWSPVVNAVSIDDQVAIFNSIITQLYDKHAPLRPVKMKHLPAPWITEDIRKCMHKKFVAKCRYTSRPTDINHEKYVKARNHCNMVCRDALRRYIHASVDDRNPAKVWKFLRSMGIGKSNHSAKPNTIDLDSLNSHFSSSFTMSTEDKNSTICNLSALPAPDFAPFEFNLFTESDVEKSILSITSNAVGGDSIGKNMLLPILHCILPILCLLFNNSISCAEFPAIWKDAQVIPLPKKPNPTSYSEYRPISILPFLSKVLERLVHRQINHFLTRHDLLDPLQSGFRPGHSTVTALIRITDDICEGMDHGKLTILTLLDFSNAFNSVDLDIMLAILRSLNISPSVLDWFRSYLCGRRQRVRLGDSFSSWCNTLAGVPQGGVLSPLLFAVFINSISHSLSSSYHLYADDLQIYRQAHVSDMDSAIAATNDDLNRILEWSRSFGLRVNPSKTQVIIVGSSRMISRIDWNTIPPVTFNEIIIPYSKSVKNLGVMMDQCLSWDAHLDVVSRKLFASGASLRRLRNFLPTATKIALAQSLLLPILDYADACYLDLREDQLDKLERLQNYCIRFIFGLRKYDHVSEFRDKLKWLPIRFRRNAHILTLVFNILFNPTTPRYLKCHLNYVYDSHSRDLRSSEGLTLSHPEFNSPSFFGRSFAVQAVRLWNTLPLKIRKAPSLESFKTQVKNWYLSQQIK